MKQGKPQVLRYLPVGVAAVAALLGSLYYGMSRYDPVDMETFQKDASITETTAMIGTNITLHQEIHGLHGTTYRYKLKTDCPHWDYEGRYVSSEPLAWAGPHGAAETEATEYRISWDGEVLASGQYFRIPILEMVSEDKTEQEYQEQLVKEAYQAYLAEHPLNKWKLPVILAAAFLAVGICYDQIRISAAKGPNAQDPDEKEKESEDSEHA